MTYRINNVNAYNGWDPLKQIVLGNVPLPDFFDGLPDKKLSSLLQKILEETIEDLDNIEDTLKEHGVDVVRLPHTHLYFPPRPQDRFAGKPVDIKDYIDADKPIQGPVPRPAITPRDEFITLGKKVMQTGPHNSLPGLIDPAVHECNILEEFGTLHMYWPCTPSNYQKFIGPFIPSKKLMESHIPDRYPALRPSGSYKVDWFNRFPHLELSQSDCDEFMEVMHHSWVFWGPQITRVGDTLIYDMVDVTNLDKIIPQLFPEFKKSTVAIGGHNDGTFCLPKPGLVICAPWYNELGFTPEKTFPGWDILILETENTKDLTSEYGDWHNEAKLTKGKWWHPEVKEHPELVNFVESYLNKWVGFAAETIFEVNMLSISPECILSMNYQKDIHKKLRKHGIEPIYCRFRHRNFWDGGLHCLTLDTLREGEQQNYGL